MARWSDDRSTSAMAVWSCVPGVIVEVDFHPVAGPRCPCRANVAERALRQAGGVGQGLLGYVAPVSGAADQLADFEDGGLQLVEVEQVGPFAHFFQRRRQGHGVIRRPLSAR